MATALLNRIKSRGFAPGAKALLAVIDGGKGLEAAIRKGFGGRVVIQRCLIHKERNLRRYQSRKHHGELAHLFNNLRRKQGEEARQKIRCFVASKNAEAVRSLDEAGSQLTDLQGLEVPATIHLFLLSIHRIENPLRSTLAKTGRVTNWKGNTDQPARWLAYAFQ